MRLSAPAAAYWDPGLIQSAAADSVDIVSYHAYNGADPAPPSGDGWPTTLPYYTNIKTMQGYKPGISYGVEEFNWHDASGSTAFFDYRNVLFVADVIGHVLSAGGHASFYSDSNGPLGLMNDGTGQGQPGTWANQLPAWFGFGMWTGLNGAFLKWGAHFLPCTTTFAETSLTAYACDNGKIVVINKTASDINAVISMKGKTSGGWNAYLCDYGSPSGPLSILNPIGALSYSNGILTQSIPAHSVVSFHVA